ncbi:GLPGLI family protein [Cloacibacterium sp.]|uniref:GLPGLI family protein n=1 Tax=Cloacibacterium sp. TaxID=1913682 RepID=UPI0035AE665F
MKKLIAFFVFATIFVNAQNNRFIYEYKFVSDSTKKDVVASEMMFLDITKNSSKYYSREVYVQDSIMRADLEKQMKAGVSNFNIKRNDAKGKVRYKVTKDYQKNKTYLNVRIGSDSYKVLEDRALDWKILPEKEKIGNWEAQKATTEFGGRKWTAWFCEEIPLSDGPYKFKGLPGLIVKISDADNSHVMELKGSTKFASPTEENMESAVTTKNGAITKTVVVGDGFGSSKDEIEINREKYVKLFWEDREDPAKSIKMMQGREGVVMKFKDQNGNDMSMSDMIKRREDAQKEANKRNNNLIEIDLLNKPK